MHVVHAATPPVEYDPAGQSVQLADPATEYDPAGQSVQLADPATEYDPAGQDEQEAADSYLVVARLPVSIISICFE